MRSVDEQVKRLENQANNEYKQLENKYKQLENKYRQLEDKINKLLANAGHENDKMESAEDNHDLAQLSVDLDTSQGEGGGEDEILAKTNEAVETLIRLRHSTLAYHPVLDKGRLSKFLAEVGRTNVSQKY